MNKLIIIEGLPGSGKTTAAERLYTELTGMGHQMCVFKEGDLHPADMAWCACLTGAEFDSLCSQYPNMVEDF